MWTSTSKVIQSNDVQKEKIQLDLDFQIHYHVYPCTTPSLHLGWKCYRRQLANKKIAPAAAQLVPNGEEASHRCS
jgi:hypothetical protein